MSWNSFWADVGNFFSDLKNKTSFGYVWSDNPEKSGSHGGDWNDFYENEYKEPVYDSLGVGKGTVARDQIDTPQVDLGSIKNTGSSFEKEGNEIANNVTSTLGGLSDGFTNAVSGLSNGIVDGDSSGSVWSKLGSWLGEVANSLTGVTAQQIAYPYAQVNSATAVIR